MAQAVSPKALYISHDGRVVDLSEISEGASKMTDAPATEEQFVMIGDFFDNSTSSTKTSSPTIHEDEQDDQQEKPTGNSDNDSDSDETIDATTTLAHNPWSSPNHGTRWATPNFHPTAPSWAAVISRAVYILLSPSKWRTALNHLHRLGDNISMFDMEWQHEVLRNNVPEPSQEQVFLRGVYEHARTVLDAQVSSKPRAEVLKTLWAQRYSKRSFENIAAKELLYKMWNTCDDAYTNRKKRDQRSFTAPVYRVERVNRDVHIQHN
ncbi:hypothetical protein GCG54_00000874 [Colletotrichum gloeosporioides]|uniref:Uncharacterized protein n=1 Tax=Colletotrichum gloeosporioides TaxID=474922 RepID=A0A8H4CIC0_COLGL|nr:uncharacterized protein GCG54_00000874 [Colletotrichum gloeosporioides]KAF3804520.1 hypothetical protein GCG54_00000874 [Colletotrichum gloeosporioides]